MRPIALVFYGWHNNTQDNRILAAKPLFLFDNTPKGPWHGNCSPSKFEPAGIHVYSYLTSGYEGGRRSIPSDLMSNLAFIDAIATEGVTGIFLDEVSNNPGASSLSYLREIFQRCRERGLKLIFNTGVSGFSSDLFMADYVMARENWDGTLRGSEASNPGRVLTLSQQVTDAVTAAELTNKAQELGLAGHYAGPYTSLPSWFEAYVAAVPEIVSPEPEPKPEPEPEPQPPPHSVITVALNAQNGIVTPGQWQKDAAGNWTCALDVATPG